MTRRGDCIEFAGEFLSVIRRVADEEVQHIQVLPPASAGAIRIATGDGHVSHSGMEFRMDSTVNTRYLYIMTTRLVNVRLDEQRLERARRLRAKGITLSDLVRDAIDRRYDLLVESSKDRNAEEIMNEI